MQFLKYQTGKMFFRQNEITTCEVVLDSNNKPEEIIVRTTVFNGDIASFYITKNEVLAWDALLKVQKHIIKMVFLNLSEFMDLSEFNDAIEKDLT